MTISEKLSAIQKQLKAPKAQYNSFGKYHYRSCEDLLEAVKPLLDGLFLTLADELVQIGDRYYVRAKATISDGADSIVTIAYAREEETKKGMDAAQITGACSSYARKYALNGLFLADDTKDADTMDNTKEEKKPAQKQPPAQTGVSAIQKSGIMGKMIAAGITGREQQKQFYAYVMEGEETSAKAAKFLNRFDEFLTAFRSMDVPGGETWEQ